MNNDNCIFCKISANQIPSYTIYENEMFKVIFDRFPWAKGHTLIIVKRHVENIFNLTYEEGAQIFKLAIEIANALNKTFNPEGLNIIQNNGEAAGQSVFHFHMHLIPRYKNDGIGINFKQNDPPPEEFEKCLELIKNNIS